MDTARNVHIQEQEHDAQYWKEAIQRMLNRVNDIAVLRRVWKILYWRWNQ